MSHIGDLLVTLGLILGIPAGVVLGFVAGYWWRGKRRRTVI